MGYAPRGGRGCGNDGFVDGAVIVNGQAGVATLYAVRPRRARRSAEPCGSSLGPIRGRVQGVFFLFFFLLLGARGGGGATGDWWMDKRWIEPRLHDREATCLVNLVCWDRVPTGTKGAILRERIGAEWRCGQQART